MESCPSGVSIPPRLPCRGSFRLILAWRCRVMCRRDSSRLMVVAQSILTFPCLSWRWNARCALRRRSCLPASPPAAAGNLFSSVIPVVVVVTLLLRFPGKPEAPGLFPGARRFWGLCTLSTGGSLGSFPVGGDASQASGTVPWACCSVPWAMSLCKFSPGTPPEGILWRTP